MPQNLEFVEMLKTFKRLLKKADYNDMTLAIGLISDEVLFRSEGDYQHAIEHLQQTITAMETILHEDVCEDCGENLNDCHC